MSALRHYYFINYDEDEFIRINWKKVRKFLGEYKLAVKDQPYTHDQIRKLLAVCPRKLRIVILAEAQGGPRIDAYRLMKLKDLTKNEQYGIYKVRVYPDTKSEYITYFGPEATTEIDAYIDERRRAGEDITPESPLIREDYTEKTVKNPRFLAYGVVGNTINDYLIKAGIRTKTTGSRARKETMLTHGLRKFFKQWCRRSGIDPVVVEWLVGHRNGESKIGINKLVMTYDPAVEEELLNEYLKAVDNLTISEEVRATRKNVQMQKTIEVQDAALARAMEALNYLQGRANAIPTSTTTKENY